MPARKGRTSPSSVRAEGACRRTRSAAQSVYYGSGYHTPPVHRHTSGSESGDESVDADRLTATIRRPSSEMTVDLSSRATPPALRCWFRSLSLSANSRGVRPLKFGLPSSRRCRQSKSGIADYSAALLESLSNSPMSLSSIGRPSN